MPHKIVIMEQQGFVLIEKESVPELTFPAEEILRKDSEVQIRASEMKKAIALGNLEHQKVKIYFADSEGKKYVHTTIWAVTEESVVLKQNSIIPIHRIIKLEILKKMSKKRSIISYDKLTAEQVKELEAAFPNGYYSALTQIKTPSGETIETLLWETEEVIYLVKMIRPKNQIVIDGDDDFDNEERDDFDIESGDETAIENIEGDDDDDDDEYDD